MSEKYHTKIDGNFFKKHARILKNVENFTNREMPENVWKKLNQKVSKVFRKF